MRKIVLSLLGIVFISEMVRQVFKLEGSFINYGFIFVSIGILLIYLLNKILDIKILTYIQLGLIGFNFLLMTAIYIYGYVSSVDSFGLGILIIMLFTILMSQIIVIIFHTILNRIQKHGNARQIENILILGYTLIFFMLTQVHVPTNYHIPVETWIMSYGFTFLIFIGLSFLVTKTFRKDLSIVLIIALIGLLIVQHSGVDANIFLRLPLQIVVAIFLVIKYMPLSSFSKTK